MRFDVVVVGGGAIGCLTAKECAKRGLKTALLEEHGQPGKFGQCTAIVSQKGLKSLGVDYKPFVLNEVRGARIKSPSREMVVDAKKTMACVLDRQGFDE